MRSPLLAVLLAGLTCMSACASKHAASSPTPGCPDKDEATALAGPKVAASSDEPRVKVVNAFCPIAGSHAVGESKTTVASLTRDFKGKKVGFCCASCPSVWDNMTDQEKQGAFDAALASEKKDGPKPGM